MSEFFHGGDVEAFSKKVGCKIDEVVDLSSNIHFYSPNVNIDLNTLDFKIYPKYEELYRTLAKHYQINETQLEVYNGGSSAIFTLMKEFKNKKCYIYSPAYVEYKKAAKINKKEITYINRFENINQDIEESSLVVFVNPSTPDGIYYDMEKFLNYWESKNCTILIDESFLEFTKEKSLVEYIDRYERVYVLKSLTKFYGCAGVRCGIVVSNEKNIQKLKASEPLWKISLFDSIYVQNMLKDKYYKNKALAEIEDAKEHLKTVLEGCELFENISDSKANFFLVKLKKYDALEFQKMLEPHKIMIRDCSNFDYLSKEYIRVAVKSKKDIQKFEKALEKLQF